MPLEVEIAMMRRVICLTFRAERQMDGEKVWIYYRKLVGTIGLFLQKSE
jgi:hypothetical protein